MAAIAIPQNLALDVKAGDPVTIRLDALCQQPPIESRVNRVGNSIDAQTGTLCAEIQLPNPQGLLKTGMRGEATVVIEQVPDALWLPLRALYQVNSRLHQGNCIRIVKGRTKHTKVKVGLITDNAAEILDGLAVGDVVIVEISAVPTDGQEVDISPPNP